MPDLKMLNEVKGVQNKSLDTSLKQQAIGLICRMGCLNW